MRGALLDLWRDARAEFDDPVEAWQSIQNDPDQRARYEEAHRYAARFCRRLEERFLRRRQARPEELVAQLRAFYRLGRHAKLRHAETWR